MLRWMLLMCLLVPCLGHSQSPPTQSASGLPAGSAIESPATGPGVFGKDAQTSPESTETGDAATSVVPAKACWPQLAHVDHVFSPGGMLRNVKLTEKSSLLTFASGPSYAELIKLPEFKQPYSLDFWLIFDLNFRKPSEVMVPSAVMLDRDFCQIEDLQELKFNFEDSVWSGGENEKSHVPIRSDQIKYVLVYTDARHVNDTVVLYTEGFVPTERHIRRAEKGYVMVRLNK